ncbi:MAG: hypothetical protein J2O48_03860 [Solirubrobacterales bacterium]|nr:hypothetical protein [Solirubrobacterales bacterium]
MRRFCCALLAAALLGAVLVGALRAAPARAQASKSGGQIAYLSDGEEVDSGPDGLSYAIDTLSGPLLRTRGTLVSCTVKGQEHSATYTQGTVCPTNGPAFSSDGKTLLFGGFYGPNAAVGIFKMAMPSGKPTRIPIRGLVGMGDAQFLPGNKQIVFSGQVGTFSNVRLYTVSVNGGVPKVLVNSGGQDPVVCHNGTILYNHNLGLYRLARGKRGDGKPIIRFDPEVQATACSPNGRLLAFDRADLYSADTGKHVSGHRFATGEPLWGTDAFSPSGTELAVADQMECSAALCGRYAPQGQWKDEWSTVCDIRYLEIVNLQGQVIRRQVIQWPGSCVQQASNPNRPDWYYEGHWRRTNEFPRVAWQP